MFSKRFDSVVDNITFLRSQACWTATCGSNRPSLHPFRHFRALPAASLAPMDGLYRILSVKHLPRIRYSAVGTIYWLFLFSTFVSALDVGEVVFGQVFGREEYCLQRCTTMEFYRVSR